MNFKSEDVLLGILISGLCFMIFVSSYYENQINTLQEENTFLRNTADSFCERIQESSSYSCQKYLEGYVLLEKRKEADKILDRNFIIIKEYGIDMCYDIIERGTLFMENRLVDMSYCNESIIGYGERWKDVSESDKPAITISGNVENSVAVGERAGEDWENANYWIEIHCGDIIKIENSQKYEEIQKISEVVKAVEKAEQTCNNFFGDDWK